MQTTVGNSSRQNGDKTVDKKKLTFFDPNWRFVYFQLNVQIIFNFNIWFRVMMLFLNDLNIILFLNAVKSGFVVGYN